MKEIRLQVCLEPGRLEAGCDEAGRGPLAGPVYAAAVILPPGFYHPLLNDSKQMTEKAREERPRPSPGPWRPSRPTRSTG